ncbi:MAG: VWA domain-containing protein [Patescibacteria group bacterium]
MKRKIALGAIAMVAVGGSIVGMSAFEAHVINVTARIENALFVPTSELNFGTVFPQEAFDKTFDVSLSQSFQDEDRVDDVLYMLRQKPKCADNPNNPTEFSQVSHDPETGEFFCEKEGHEILPLLCPYLSKEELTEDGQRENDEGVISAFHGPILDWDLGDTWATQVSGKLIKSLDDLSDTWNIDLKVPCFGNHCAQDWEEFVAGVNASAIPAAYVQPIANEHKIFGCDLWIEVLGISLPDGGIPCDKDIDLMLVLDRSGSINAGELTTLKTAAKAFVDALVPATPGAHVGMVSFSSSASLDAHLTDDGSAVKTAIDALVSGGTTNLEAALLAATTELANPGDGHDRADATSPDFIVLITDGAPTSSNTHAGDPQGDPDHATDAAAAATVAKAAGVEIFVVGVGTTGATATYLESDIASTDPPEHYFDAADFGALEAILEALAECPNGEEPAPPAPDEVTILSDGFGEGSTSATISGWEKHEDGTVAQAPSGSGENSASPNGGRFVRIADDSSDADSEDGWICREIDATGYDSLELSYYWRGDSNGEGSEQGLVEYFTGGTCASPVGGPNNLATHALSPLASWSLNSISFPGALNSTTFLVRFYNDSSANDESFRVDGVVLSGIPI